MIVDQGGRDRCGGPDGREVCRAVTDRGRTELVGRFDQGDDLGDLGGAEVVVEFSVPGASPANVAHCVERGVHVVVGTTGWDEARLATLRDQLAEQPSVGVLIAPNFAIGAILMMRFAAAGGPVLRVGRGHRAAPPQQGGRAVGHRSAHRRASSPRPAPTPGSATSRTPPPRTPTARAASRVDGIPVHSVRLRGLVAHQEVLLGGEGEMLTLRHDSFDRTSFMPGVLQGIRGVAAHPGLTVGLEHYLGLDD